VGQQIADLILTETVSLFVGQVIIGASRYFFFYKILKKDRWGDNITKQLPDFSIWVLYNKTLHWLMLLLVPYFVFLIPVIDYVSFRVLYLIIRNFFVSSN